MRLGHEGLALIQRFEGFSPEPYLCPAGRWTIGYGHVILPFERKELQQIDPYEARGILMVDVSFAEQAVAQWIRVGLTQNQFDALVSFTFNLGAATLQRSTLRRVVNRREHADVPAELMRFVWSRGRKLSGLVRRRAAEAALYSRVNL